MAELPAGAFDAGQAFGIQLAVEEAIINAVEHGNNCDMLKHVTIDYSITPQEFEISVTDEGGGFRPEDVPDPCSDEGLNRASGRGIALMRAYMDSVEYNDKGNHVRMRKRCAGPQAAP
jgi:serine/threonine-protein kinase RsbW